MRTQEATGSHAGYVGVGIQVVAIASISLGMLQQVVIAEAQGRPEKPAWCEQLPRPAYSKLKRVPFADTWFEVYIVAPSVFAIYERTGPKRRLVT